MAIDHIYKTNSERIVGIQIKCKTHEPLFVFGVYLPADSSIDNFREELNALDDLYAYYSNYGQVVIEGDLNSSCVNTNIDGTYKAKSNELQCFVKRHSFYHTFKDGNIPFKGPELTFTLKRIMLDYILFHESHVRQGRRYAILEEGSFSSISDHLPVIATVYVEENPHIEMNSYLKLPSWHKITNDLMAKYQGELRVPLSIKLTATI